MTVRESKMTMREKIARALYQCAGERDTQLHGLPPRRPFDQFKGDTWDGREMWYALADAALDTLMEPTEEMSRTAGEWGVGEQGKRVAETLSKNAFITMIRAAKEGK